MFRSRILVVFAGITVTALGCGKSNNADELAEIDTQTLNDSMEKLESLTNVHDLPADQKRQALPLPRIICNDNEVNLSDLELIFRRVRLDPPIEGGSIIFVSETEVTNRMYAVFLQATGKFRDDTEVEKAAAGEYTTITTDGRVRQIHSTAMAAINQDYWGYTHSRNSRSDEWGFRIVFVPE